MAFPTVSNVATQAFTTSTTHNVTMPGTVSAGDLLILAFYAENGGVSFTNPSGWTVLAEDDFAANNTGASGRLIVYGRDADGTEGGTSVNVATDASRVAASILYRIAAASWMGDLATDVDVSAATIPMASGAAGDPASVSAGWGSADNLFIVFSATADDPNPHTAAPTNYTNLQTIDTGAIGTGGTIGSAVRELAAASDDPDAFTFTTAPPTFDLVTTLVVRPSSGGSPVVNPDTRKYAPSGFLSTLLTM